MSDDAREQAWEAYDAAANYVPDAASFNAGWDARTPEVEALEATVARLQGLEAEVIAAFKAGDWCLIQRAYDLGFAKGVVGGAG